MIKFLLVGEKGEIYYFTIPEDLNTIIKELSKEVNRENTQNIKVINIMSSVTCSYSYSNIF